MPLSSFKQFEERDTLFRTSKGKVKEPPVLPKGVRVADTHCHLGTLNDAPLALARCACRGVRFLECITDPTEEDVPRLYESLEGWRAQAQALLEEWGAGESALPRVRMACGVHPHNAKDWAAGEGALRTLLAHPLTSCMGEIGLDYHYDLSPRPVQREVFARQLQLAQEAGVPVALHLREAHADALAILREQGVPQAGCIVHCFNLDAATLAPFVELGCYIALGGPLTFRKSFETRAACVDVPLDRLLTETDAPYMAPEPLRGTVCLPDHVVYTLRMLLDCFGYAGEEAALALMTPRASDVGEGVEPEPLAHPGFAALQCGQSEAGFAALLYRNATQLLDRPNPRAGA